jgi:hypothetical protein
MQVILLLGLSRDISYIQCIKIGNMMNMLDVLICLVRLLVFLPLICLIFLTLPLMYLLGVKEPMDKWVKFNESIVFNIEN